MNEPYRAPIHEVKALETTQVTGSSPVGLSARRARATRRAALPAVLLALICCFHPRSVSAKPAVPEIMNKLLDADPWGLGGAAVTAHVLLKDKRGVTSELAFSGRSRRYAPLLSKTIVRFTAPADLAGAGFLQIQQREGDDDRFLFLPELKRSRRISGNLRSTSFMGTDFSFADLDRRDLREGRASARPDESIGKYLCFHVDVLTTRADSPYSHIELWIRTDNYLPLKMAMYDKAGRLLKTFTALELQRVSGQWYITKSRMFDHSQSHQTELALDSVTPIGDISEEEFTLRNLEKF